MRTPVPFAALVVVALSVSVHAAVARTDVSNSAGGPAIVLPDGLLTGSQREDAPIDVKFVTAPDTSVDLGSLHIWVHKFLGWIDVTNRLAHHPRAYVGGWGIHLDAGVLPAGEHQIRVAFHDMQGRAVEAIETIRIAEVVRR